MPKPDKELAAFTTDQLEAELQRRANAGHETRYYQPRPRHYCDESYSREGCKYLYHLKLSEAKAERDPTYGARCRLNHELHFRLDLDDNDPHSEDWGWHRKDRRKCPDFAEKTEPGGHPICSDTTEGSQLKIAGRRSPS